MKYSEEPIVDELFNVVYNKTETPLEAVNYLLKTIFATIKFGEIEYDKEHEQFFTDLFKAENVKKIIDGIDIKVTYKE